MTQPGVFSAGWTLLSQEQVLTTDGATRLVDRMEAAGLVERAETPATGAAGWDRGRPLGVRVRLDGA